MKQQTRTEVLQRDGYRCQDCGEPVGQEKNPHVETAHIHHVTPRSDGGSDDPGNLLTLCDGCHKERHAPDGEAEDERRALLTEDEDAILRGEREVSEKYYYVVVSRVRKKIQKLANEDLPALKEHDTLAGELRDGVCED